MNFTYKYYLDNQQVCRQLFINTLGLTCGSKIVRLYAKCDKLGFNYNSLICLPLDKKNNFKRKHSSEFCDLVKSFIDSKNPQQSHYDFEKVPKRLYIEI